MFSDLSWIFWCLAILLVALSFYVICYKIHQSLRVVFKPFQKGKTYWCRIIAVSDGDTVTCKRFNLRGSQTKLRLAYIDAPESSQKYGIDARNILKKMLEGKIVRVQIQNSDRYGRHIAVIHARGKNVNEEMLKLGAAWVYEDYIKDINHLKHLNQLQAQAKKKQKGLWQYNRPIHPSLYRKQNS